MGRKNKGIRQRQETKSPHYKYLQNNGQNQKNQAMRFLGQTYNDNMLNIIQNIDSKNGRKISAMKGINMVIEPGCTAKKQPQLE